ncbi:MAG: glycosyl transferase family 2 [Bacteroidetes bacterium]|uniref:polyprenol monophosphomannose synthase n=1 Tax=Chitinophaga TaxID=79328 RepID=UPI001D3626C8|nr:MULTISPECIES: polyprenol monophosphomannose synthase [Chitinophaga]MBP1652876.1 glycosyl transferase family 2 [Bacteroidota bacterium]WPQ65701.1 polyprenol monophosphomannose synthase [Chitinophaga sancti]WPV70137.1 polyprenol monophosphomannose synthase [Chitinophaga sp. LS1]
MEKLVIIPTYNEKDNIRKIIDAVFSLQEDFHILIVDDGSPDGTGNIVKSLQQQHPGELFLSERSGKQGLGTAYIHGFKWALAKGYQYIFEMDADFSHNPKDLPRLYNACAREGGDVAVGSRYVKGGRTENWPWDRAVLSYGASVYVRFVTWMRVKDATAGFVCYKRQVLESINLDAIRFVGYAFQIEMKFTAWKLGFKVKEVPITFIDRKEGYSKMSKGIVKEGILGVLKIQWESLFRKYERRVRNEQLQEQEQ